MKLFEWLCLRTWRGLLILALALLAGCAGQPSGQPGGGEEREATSLQEQEASEEAEDENEHAGDMENGKKLFLQTCATCHGETGEGNGPAAAALEPKPRDFTDSSVISKLSDEHIAKSIREGGASVGKSPVMPAHPQFNDEEIADLVAFIRSLEK